MAEIDGYTRCATCGHEQREHLAEVEPMTLESTLAAITAAWNEERCTLEFQYIPEWSGNNAEHTIALEWTDDSGWLANTCTYVTYRWQFTNDTFAEAAADALAWVTALAPWRRCDECDGQGRWNDEECAPCAGTGLASEGPGFDGPF